MYAQNNSVTGRVCSFGWAGAADDRAETIQMKGSHDRDRLFRASSDVSSKENMAHIVIMGAGVGGMPAAYEMRARLRCRAQDHGRQRGRHLPVHAVQPVGGGGLARALGDITLPIARCWRRRALPSSPGGGRQSTPPAAGSRWTAATRSLYDYRHHDRPKLSFDEVPGAGPYGGAHALGVHGQPRRGLLGRLPGVPEGAGLIVIGAMPLASCSVRPTSSPSSSTPTCAAGSCATRYRSPSSPASPHRTPGTLAASAT